MQFLPREVQLVPSGVGGAPFMSYLSRNQMCRTCRDVVTLTHTHEILPDRIFLKRRWKTVTGTDLPDVRIESSSGDGDDAWCTI